MSQTETVTASTASAPALGKVAPRKVHTDPNDPLFSDWHLKDDLKESSLAGKLLYNMGILPRYKDSEHAPIHDKNDPVRHLPDIEHHKFILPRILPPIILHRALYELTGYQMPAPVAFLWYSTFFLLFGVSLLKMLRRMTLHYGFFDGKVERDGIPNNAKGKTLKALLGIVMVRPLLVTFIAYDKTQVPGLHWSTPIHVSAFCIVLDFFFYWYHRVMHNNATLWHIHELHHTTKHPNCLLSAYGSELQELGDILIIPGLTYAVTRLDFYTWYIAACYLAYTEAAGHSGCRLNWGVPATSWLSLFGCDLRMEDHDLHHRLGKKKSFNYGKQTLLWDTIFGTRRARIEAKADNIDYKNPAKHV